MKLLNVSGFVDIIGYGGGMRVDVQVMLCYVWTGNDQTSQT